ncbi:hypothetical protein N7470_003653 [Penicillium chermesinum]|nr:hypothetical protein N7470_003653 [Penicillium chermesinum]
MEDPPHLQDLELMVNWCTSTYRSMARDSSAELIWQSVVPQLSLRAPALRHGLLALSALEVASQRSTPERKWRYIVAAREHQSLALAGVRFDDIDTLSDAQCNAHFALCCVLLAFSFAYCIIMDWEEEEEEDERPDVPDEFLEVFYLTRWLVGALLLTKDRVSSGDLYPLVQSPEPRPTMPDMSRLVILSIRRQNEIESRRDPTHKKDVYTQTIDHLSHSLEQLMNGGEPKDFAFCWAFRIPMRFSQLVRDRRPFALVVLAHYAVVLHHLRESWWMGNWGTRILKEIVDLLEFDSEWRELISWPLDAVGWFLPELPQASVAS